MQWEHFCHDRYLCSFTCMQINVYVVERKNMLVQIEHILELDINNGKYIADMVPLIKWIRKAYKDFKF